MKNIYIITIILLTFLIACNDEYLQNYPPLKITDQNFWNSETDIKIYANQFYPYLREKVDLWKVDNKTDDQGPADRDSYAWGETSVPTTGGGWGKSDWLPIRRINYALTRIARMEKDPLVLRYEGEIRFFKAFFYFDKVRRFGDVPWFEKELETDSEELYSPRDSRKEVISNILKELNFAIENLPETSSELRLTKYAALAFKTEMCLFEGTFRKYHGIDEWQPLLREAVNAAEEIINSGLFKIYSTGKPLDDYYNLFLQRNLVGNKEGIMVQAFELGVSVHDTPRDRSISRSGFTKDFVESYLCTDGLPISLSGVYQGDMQFKDEFINRDPRMWQSVYHPDRPYLIAKNGTITYMKEETILKFAVATFFTGYTIIKEMSMYEDDRESSKGDFDQFIFRYGELLVSYAEAKAELGECTQDVLDISINKLRDRVNMPHLSVDVGFVDPNWPVWEVPPSPLGLINEIRRERRIEIASEGKRWWDLVRWKAGKLLENPKVLRGARDPKTGNYRLLYPSILERKWHNRLYLQPIPKQDLTLNPNLEQNPGWENF